ncbi:hypothetical protein ACH5RR_035742 [Cinchona calisaya]|uniref:Uncharacterized protein n=1 Tax=Cinchona calisaya TaxID=153742 RepID=A0ABD2Y2A5_9GENT
MAGAATATATATLSRRQVPSIPIPPSHNTFYSIHRTPLHPYYKHNKITHHFNARLLSCNAKLSGESEDFSEVIFGADEVMEDYDESDGEEEEDNTESSIDLLLRLVQSMFKKVSKRARKASRSILPEVISPQLVSFAVDGVLLLASLSILKALLEVVCTLGGTVFVVILLLRVIWSAVSYFQSSGTGYNQNRSSYGRTQPVN